MWVLDKIVSEEDVLEMPEELLKAFGKMLNDVLSEVILNYTNNPEANPEAVKRINDVLGDTLKRNTFHKEVLSKNILPILNAVSLEDLAENPMDYQSLIDMISWLDENKNYIISNIKARTKDDYLNLVELAEDYSQRMARAIKGNKSVFYAGTKEKSKNTRMGSVLTKKFEHDIIKKGSQYILYCNSHGIRDWRCTEF